MAAGNRARLAFIETLATLEETRLYLELGCPSIVVYGERCFGYHKSEIYECLRMHEAIGLLRRPAEAFATGQLSWSQLREITRVATPETEEPWIAFAREHTVAELRAEVKDAGRNGRDRPRDDGGGLPNLEVKFTVELTRSEHHALSTAMEKLARELSVRIGGGPVEVRDVLLHMAETMLATEPGGTPEGRRPREESHHAILGLGGLWQRVWGQSEQRLKANMTRTLERTIGEIDTVLSAGSVPPTLRRRSRVTPVSPEAGTPGNGNAAREGDADPGLASVEDLLDAE